MLIASQLVDPRSIDVSFEDVAGSEDTIKEIKQAVVLPIQKRKLFEGSELMAAPKGVLLHGPPGNFCHNNNTVNCYFSTGCGKTMLAKATAKEAGARFINLDISRLILNFQLVINFTCLSLTDKWYGESQKLAGAVFTLAASSSSWSTL